MNELELALELARQGCSSAPKDPELHDQYEKEKEAIQALESLVETKTGAEAHQEGRREYHQYLLAFCFYQFADLEVGLWDNEKKKIERAFVIHDELLSVLESGEVELRAPDQRYTWLDFHAALRRVEEREDGLPDGSSLTI